MNKVIIDGNIVEDCELMYVGESALAKFTIANNKKTSDKDIVTYVPCSMWNGMAESLCDYLKKGQQVFICGELSIKNEKDKEGKWHSYTTVNVRELSFGRSPKKEESKQEKQKYNRNNNTNKSQPKNTRKGYLQTNEDIPF